MELLKQRWKAWSMRLDALSFRERVLVFLAVAGAALSLMFVGLIEPALKQQEQMLAQANELQQEIFGLHEQLAQIEHENQSGLNSELGRLQKEAVALEQDVKARESALISPDRMIAAIRTLLTAQPGLTLVTLQTSPPSLLQLAPTPDEGEGNVPEQGTADQVTQAEPFYKHGVTVQLQGSYAQLADYVARLESMPWAAQWESVTLDASRHPRIVMTLKLNTLSRESTWARL